jgi:hypothetical protein
VTVGTPLSALLNERGTDPRIADLLVDLARSRGLERCSEGDQLAFSAATDAYAAVYVTGGSLSIALDPDDARRARERLGFGVEERNPSTHYVKLSADALSDQTTVSEVRALLDTALDRAYAGPRWERGLPDRTLRHGQVCPNCHQTMSVTGVCDNCG